MSLPIQTADPQTRLVKRYSTVGRMDLRIDETVVPVVLLDDVRETGESGAAVSSGFAEIAAGADTAIIEFRNPLEAAGIIAETSRIHVAAGNVANPVRLWVAQPQGQTPIVQGLNDASQRDWRDQQRIGPQIGSFPPAGAGGNRPPILVLPGSSVFTTIDIDLGIANYTFPPGFSETVLVVTMIPGGSIFIAQTGAPPEPLAAALDYVVTPRRA